MEKPFTNNIEQNDILVLKARDFAIKKHAQQVYGKNPYIYHLDMVHSIVIEAQLSLEYRIASYLHDCLEDTQTSKKEIEDLFNANVAQMVWAVSGFGSTRKEKKEDMISKLVKNPQAIDLKMADRLANMRESFNNNPELFKMYIKEMQSYDEIFKKGNKYLYDQLKYLQNLSKQQKKIKP